MRRSKRILAVMIMLIIVIVSMPIVSRDVYAGMDLENGGTLYAGNTATIICQGETNYYTTNFIFEGSPVIGRVTRYDSEGNIVSEKEVCGDYYQSPILCEGGEKFVIEVYYGEMQISFNGTASDPDISVQSNGKVIEELIKTNITHVYLTVGETVEYGISWVEPGYYAEVVSRSGYVTDDKQVATVSRDGVITASGIGETTITMEYEFGRSEKECFWKEIECIVTVVDDYGIKDAHDEYYAAGNDKYFNIVIPDDNTIRTTGFDIELDGKTYNTGNDYQMMITFPDSYSKDVIISKEGFIPYTLKNKYISSYNWITLYKENGGLPVIQAVQGRCVEQNEWDNLLVKTLNITEGSIEKYEIDINMYWGNKNEDSVWIQQGDVKIPINNGTTGELALGQYLLNNGLPVFVCAKTTDGLVIKSQILINIFAPDEYMALDFGDEGGLEGELTGDVDAIKNHPFSFKLSGAVPIKYSVDEDGKISGSIGIEKSAYEDKYSYYDEIKEAVHNVSVLGNSTEQNSKKVKNLIDKIEKKGGDVHVARSEFGVSCDVTFLGYFEGYLEEGKTKITEIGMLCNVSGDVKYTQQSLAFAVPYYWQIGIGAEIEAKLLVLKEETSGEFQVQLPETEFKFSISGTLAIGLDKIIGAGVRAVGEYSILIPSGSEKATDSIWTISIKFYPVMQFLGMEYTEEFWDSIMEWQIYPYENPNNIDLTSTLSNANNMRQISRNYLLERRIFGLNSIDMDNTLSTEIIAENTYTDTKPQIVSIEGKEILVWVGDDSLRTDENRTCLYYSVYNEATQTWKTPQAVFNDGKADFNPILKIIDDNIYLVWQKASEEFAQGVTLSEIATKLDIFYAEFDTTTEEFFSIKNISTENNVYDYMPTVSKINDKISVIWAQNTGNNIWSSENVHSICKTTLSETEWNEIVIASNIKTVSGIAVGEENNNTKIYFAADTDEDFFTSEDIEIFTIENEQIKQITKNEVVDVSPEIIDEELYWYSDGKLTDGVDVISCLSDDVKYHLISNEDGSIKAALYTVSTGITNNIFATINDGNGWGEPIQITDYEDSYIADFNAYFENNELVVVMNQRMTDTDSGLGKASIIKCVKRFDGDISVDNLEYEPYSIIESGLLHANVSIENKGTKTVKSLTIEISDENGTILSVNDKSVVILPGDIQNIDIYCNVADIEGEELVVRAICNDFQDSNQSNNIGTMKIYTNDISLENSFTETNSNNEVVMTVFAVNRGLTPLTSVELVFYKNGLDGEIIGSRTIDLIEPGKTEIVTFTTGELDEGDIIYVTTEINKQENLYSNNSDFSFVKYSSDEEILNILLGDINNDSIINAKDVALLRRYLAGGWNVIINEISSDVNSDGIINAKDVALLRRFLAGGWNVELG